ncbi:MAG: hypothetical protein U1F77_08870 [Kiritimatiellia bacterium]
MNFHILENMTAGEASAFLAEFLSHGGHDKPRLSARADYTMPSLVSVLEEVAGLMQTTERQPDITLPEWIRTTESYRDGLFDFDAQSKRLLMWVAFYLGETFVRSNATLSWGTGAIDFAQCNSPVVRGFQHGLELSVILVTENLLRDICGPKPTPERVWTAVKYWEGMTEPQPSPSPYSSPAAGSESGEA